MALQRKMIGDKLCFFDGQKEILSLKETVQEDCVLIEINGSLRSDTEHDFQDELLALTVVGMKMLVNFKGVEYISAGCQNVLLMVEQKIEEMDQGGLVLTAVSPKIKEEFEKTGLSELLYFED